MRRTKAEERTFEGECRQRMLEAVGVPVASVSLDYIRIGAPCIWDTSMAFAWNIQFTGLITHLYGTSVHYH